MKSESTFDEETGAKPSFSTKNNHVSWTHNNPNNVSAQWPKDLPILFTVRSPLEQVLNLIGNVIKHNHPGSEGAVVSATQEKDLYRFFVEDIGLGSTPKAIVAFSKFTKGSAPRTQTASNGRRSKHSLTYSADTFCVTSKPKSRTML